MSVVLPNPANSRAPSLWPSIAIISTFLPYSFTMNRPSSTEHTSHHQWPCTVAVTTSTAPPSLEPFFKKKVYLVLLFLFFEILILEYYYFILFLFYFRHNLFLKIGNFSLKFYIITNTNNNTPLHCIVFFLRSPLHCIVDCITYVITFQHHSTTGK